MKGIDGLFRAPPSPALLFNTSGWRKKLSPLSFFARRERKKTAKAKESVNN